MYCQLLLDNLTKITAKLASSIAYHSVTCVYCAVYMCAKCFTTKLCAIRILQLFHLSVDIFYYAADYLLILKMYLCLNTTFC